MLTQVRDFFVECGGPNGDTADHNYDKALAWPFEEEDYIDIVTGRVAREKLSEHPADKPFYMLCSFCGPHKPYDAPQRYLDMIPMEREDDFLLPDGQVLTEEEKETLYRQRRSAKAMIKLIDDQIGLTLDLLEERGMLEDTLILFTSDHGDMLGDHYMIQKGVPWRQAVNVPLAALMPGVESIGTNNSPIELSDIAATILDYAGLDAQSVMSRSWPAYNDVIPSRSILPILRGETNRCRDFCFSESDFTEERKPGTDPAETVRHRGGDGRRDNAWQTIITENSKYIKYLGYKLGEAPYEEFYDLLIDPDETINRIDDPTYDDQISEARNRLSYMVDHYPVAQMTWSTACAAERKIF